MSSFPASKSWPQVPAVWGCPNESSHSLPSPSPLKAPSTPKESTEDAGHIHNARKRAVADEDLSYDYTSVVGVLHIGLPHKYVCQETGNTVLGHYMGYTLKNLTNATYLYHTPQTNDSVKQRYDHYTIQYFNHNAQEVATMEEITEDMLAVCVGDSANVCPPRTRALCTSHGVILCVAISFIAKPCAGLKSVDCIKSSIPCVLEPQPKCYEEMTEQATEIEIPCLYYTKMLAEVVYNKDDFSFSWKTPENSSPSDDAKTATDSLAEPEKYYCVTVVATPAQFHRSKELVETDNVFGKFIAEAFQF